MEKTNYESWNRLVYYVSSIYRVTGRFKPGVQRELGEKIRRTAVAVTASINAFENNDIVRPEDGQLSLVLSSLSVLETYLQLAKQHKLLRDTRVLDEELTELKESMRALVL